MRRLYATGSYNKTMPVESPTHVVKLGGSLMDMPDLVERFNQWRFGALSHQLLLVVGGGRAADVVRQWDSMHQIGEEAGHWFAIRAMQLNTHLVQAIFPSSQMVYDRPGAEAAWRVKAMAIVDPHLWLRTNEMNGLTSPHVWSFTSDSIAAHIANQLGAERLTLMKSTIDDDIDDIHTAAQVGLVDSEFPLAVRDVPNVSVVNLRSNPAQERVLQEAT